MSNEHGSLNKIVLIGSVIQKPDSGNNSNITRTSVMLMTYETWNDKITQEQQVRRETHKIVAFGNNAQILKGVNVNSRLYIEGSVQTRKYLDDSGVEKYFTSIVVGARGSIIILNERFEDPNIIDFSNTGRNADFNRTDNKNKMDDKIPF